MQNIVLAYPNEAKANEHLAKMARAGWSLKAVTTSDGHVNIGRTTTAAVLTGGISLLFGGSRTQGRLTVAYEGPDGAIIPSIETKDKFAQWMVAIVVVLIMAAWMSSISPAIAIGLVAAMGFIFLITHTKK